MSGAGPVQVRVPATSANLGPGYDAFGLALDLYDDLTAELAGSGWRISVEGEGAGSVPEDGTHLVARAMTETFTALGVAPDGVRLRCVNRIPHGRGLGSSSAAIVGGIVAARALVSNGADRLDDHAALVLADRIEGHPDNVAPALLGGFQIAGHTDDQVFSVTGRVSEALSAVLLVPAEGVLTTVARGLLPATVPHADAAVNAGRAGLLVAALADRPDQLLTATEDRLHQRYRAPAMPASADLVARLREDGVAAVISGAGPTVLALVVSEEESAAVAGHCPDGWRTIRVGIGVRGATVLA